MLAIFVRLLVASFVFNVLVEGQGGSGSGNNGCVDLNAPGRASDCPSVAYLCKNTLYQTLMAQQCPSTCGLCGGKNGGGNNNGGNKNNNGGGNNNNCKDKSAPGRVSDCQGMASYCQNPFYANLMTQQCPATCGKC